MNRNSGVVIAFILLVSILAAGCSLIEGEGGQDAAAENLAGEGSLNSGTIIITQQTVPPGQPGTFQFTGVPSGTISSEAAIVLTDLEPGTYSTTERDPAPDYDVTRVECDDNESGLPSSGDPSSRTAVINLDAGETVRCMFTNTRRGALVIANEIIPDGSGGSFLYTGVPSGTIPSNGTLVVADLSPGTYTSTQADPAPDFDLVRVICDDEDSNLASSGDPSSRSAIFNLDPGEMVTCTFINARRGTLVIANETVPSDAGGNFLYTGVPSGTVASNGTLVVANLQPGTYTSTLADPAPAFELTEVECNDGGSSMVSSGDPVTRSAVFNLDPGETVTCTFTTTAAESLVDGETRLAGGTSPGGGEPAAGTDPGQGRNPFDNPVQDLDLFPLPDELPPDAGSDTVPKAGPWSITHFAGQMNCGVINLAIPASPPESGILEVLDGGQTLIGSGLRDALGATITMTADPEIMGRYAGAFQGEEQGIPITINYFWQVLTDEFMVGYLSSEFTSEGVACQIYRAYEMTYSGTD